MDHLPRLLARISTLHEFHNIVRALLAMAATHVQEAQATLPAIRRYVEIIEDGIAEAASLGPSLPAHDDDDPGASESVLIALCSEHGFVGAFNERVLDLAATALPEHSQLAIVGWRGALLAGERDMKPAWTCPMAGQVRGVLGLSRQIAARLVDAGTRRADIVYGAYRRGANFEVTMKRLLPIDTSPKPGLERRQQPLHHISPNELMSQLSGEYLLAEIAHALAESLASENGARLRLMQAADQSITDKLDDLKRREHTLRQEATTSELLDLVIGVQAIMDGQR